MCCGTCIVCSGRHRGEGNIFPISFFFIIILYSLNLPHVSRGAAGFLTMKKYIKWSRCIRRGRGEKARKQSWDQVSFGWSNPVLLHCTSSVFSLVSVPVMCGRLRWPGAAAWQWPCFNCLSVKHGLSEFCGMKNKHLVPFFRNIIDSFTFTPPNSLF